MARDFQYDLWRTHSSGAGYERVTRYGRLPSAPNPFPLGVLGGSLLFAATNGNQGGHELWATVRALSDFDGDGRADAVVYRPNTGQWWIDRSLGNFSSWLMVPWGISTDVPVPADFDGDGKADPAVFRPDNGGGTSYWFIRRSSTDYADSYWVNWGIPGDIPVPGYYDTDRLADPAVFRPSTGQWFVNRSSTGYADAIAIQWGVAGDIPVPADYDGDRRTDIAIYRPSTGQWFIKRSDSEFVTVAATQWGAADDVPVPGAYFGEPSGPTVFRPALVNGVCRSCRQLDALRLDDLPMGALRVISRCRRISTAVAASISPSTAPARNVVQLLCRQPNQLRLRAMGQSGAGDVQFVW